MMYLSWSLKKNKIYLRLTPANFIGTFGAARMNPRQERDICGMQGLMEAKLRQVPQLRLPQPHWQLVVRVQLLLACL